MENSSEVRESLYGFPIREPDKRRNPNGRVVDIKQLWSRQKEIIRLDSLGYKGSDIASMLNIDPATVSNCLNSTLGKEAKENIRALRDLEYEDLLDDVIELTKKSMKVYEEILDNNSKNIPLDLRKETADTVALELAGMRAPTKIESQHVGTVLTADELLEIKARGKAVSLAMGKAIDIGD